MSRLIRSALPVLAAFILAPTTSADFVPDPGPDIPQSLSLSTGEPFYQNPIGQYRVHARGPTGPYAGARVVVQFATAADIALAPGQASTVEMTTDSNGEAVFHFQGGGCYTQECLGFPPATVSIYVDGELFKQGDVLVVNSPSPVDAGGLTRCEGGSKCDEVNGQWVSVASVSDAVWVSPAIKLGLVEPCANFTPPFDSPVALDDAVYLSAYMKRSSACGCTP